MEASKWILTITLAFLLATLPVTLRNLESNQVVQYPYLGDLTNILLGKFGEWSLGKQEPTEENKKIGFKAVAPNLTACHANYGRDDLIVYCCPPGFEKPEPFVDFQFPDPRAPKRVRRPTYNLDDDYIAKYNKAMSIMKSLPFDDPRSFARQANMHCLFCIGAYEQLNSHKDLNIHRTWLFFPWHRMMIYFNERIIGSLIGDDTFALPVWTWDIPQGMVIPDMFANKSLSFFHTERDFSHLPPKTVDLNYALPETDTSHEEQIEINLAFMYNQMVSGARKTELFMGCTYKANEGWCNGPGTIEAAPHNTVHTWVGSPLNVGREDMGKFYSAARDPIFYAHHANIDRLWEVWRELNQHRLEIEDPDWLESFFFFYDENLKLVRIKVRDVLDITKLGYSYEEVERTWLNKRPTPSVPPKVARQMLKQIENEKKYLQLSSNRVSPPDFGPHGRALDSSLTVKVERSKSQWMNKEKDVEEVIIVQGIQVKGGEYVKFDVYVNMVDETIMSPKSREYVGTFADIHGGGEMMKEKINLKFGISELLEDLEAERDDCIWVTLIPKTASCSNVTIGGVRIDYIK